ncbi:MAG: ice-binding family protein [Bacteroidales bacterium]|nr:ice-binding family protein [Bacteroidales bacterium]
MNRYLYILYFAALFFTSCVREDIPGDAVQQEGELINISGAYTSPQTKTTLNGLVTSWESTDKVGIYCAQAKNPGGVVGVKNAEFTAITQTVSTFFDGTIFWGAGVHQFYSYYPYNAANSSKEATEIPITLPSIQSQAGSTYSHIGDIDFLVSTPKSFNPLTQGAATPVDLVYNHVFSMIEFKVLIPQGTTKFNKIEITTSAAANLSLTSGIIDLTQVKPEGDAVYAVTGATGLGSSTLNITGDCIITNDPATSAGAMLMVIPGNHTGGAFTVNAYTDLGVTTVIRDGINIKRNNKYNLTIIIPFIDLKSAKRFGILSGVGVSSSGASIIYDMDVGISPGLLASITGFPPATVVNGAIYAPDDITPGTEAMLTQAKADLTSAYLAAEAAISPIPVIVAGDIGGTTLTPGIYKSSSTLLVQSGNLTLDAQGNTNAFWVFQVADELTTIGGAGGNILLINGAKAENIFWQIGISATIGDNTSFKGNILALTSITLNAGATVEGRVLARNGAVVLTDTNIITKP